MPADKPRRRIQWRWVFATLVLLAILGFGAGLPWLVRRVIVEQASAALRTRVDVGDVDIFLPWGTVILKKVAVWPPPVADAASAASQPTAPPATPGPSETPGPTAAATPAHLPLTQPVLAWRSLLVDVDWLPLFSRTVRLGKIALEGPIINVDRLASGEINLVELINNAVKPPDGATPSPTPEPTPTPDPAAAWHYGVDRLAITGGRLGFRDFVVGQTEPLLVRIPDIRAEQLSLSPDLYGDPSAAGLHILLDEGSVDVKARASLPAAGPVAHVTVEARRLPLRRSRLYVPVVGWSELDGELDADVQYDLETGARHGVTAAVTLRDVVIKVPDVPDAALATRRLFVHVDPLDLEKRAITVAAVDLEGAWLGVWTTGTDPLLPVFSRRAGAASAAAPAPTPAPTPAAEAPGPPWEWRLKSLRLHDSMVRIVGPQGPIDVDVSVTGSEISSGPDPGTLSLGIATGGGTFGIDGHVRAVPPAFGGTVRAGALSLPELIVASNAVNPNPLESAALDMDLAVDAGLAPDGSAAPGPRDVHVKGSLSLNHPRIRVGADAPTEVNAATIGLGLTDLALPGVLAVVNPGDAPAAAGDIQLQGSVNIDQAAVSVGGDNGPRVATDALGVTIDALTLAGILAGPAAVKPETRGDFGDIRFAGGVALTNPNVALPGASPVNVTAGNFTVDIDTLALPGMLGGTTALARRDLGDVNFAGGLAVTEAKINLADGKGPQVGVKSMGLTDATLALTGLLAPPDAPARPESGNVGFRGTLAVAEPSIDTGAEQHLLVGARSVGLKVGDLALEGLLAKPPAAPSGDVRVRADLTIAEPRLGLASSKDLQVSARAVAVGLTNAEIPGVLGSAPKKPVRPTRVALREVRVDAPSVRVTRTAHGIVLGPQPAGTPAPTPAATASPEPANPTPSPSVTPAAGPPLEVALNRLQLTQGRVVFVDRSIKPEFNGGLTQINVDVRNFRLPGPDIGQLRVSADTPGDGTIVLSGNFNPQSGDIRFESSDVALTPYNPFARAFSPYRITDGSLFVSSNVKREGERYDTNTKITFEDFDIAGSEGDSLFMQQFGIPLSTALALLTDLDGKIRFDIPAQIDASGTSIALGPILTDVVRKALVNALAAPLKLVGSLAGGGGKFTAPAPIAFRVGRAELAPAGDEAVNHLGELLEERPALGVALSSDATTEDVRWLHEQALRTQWAEGGLLTRALAQVGARSRVEDFLDARAEDKPAELDPDDTAQLETWLKEVPEPSAEELRTLTADRLARTATALRETHRIDITRIRVDEPDNTIGEGTPVVDMGLKRTSRLFAAPAAEPTPEPEP